MKKTAPLFGATKRPGGGPRDSVFAEIVSRASRLQTATTSLLHASKRRGHRTPAFTGRIRKRQQKSLLLLGTIWSLKRAASKKKIAHLIVLDHDGLQSYFPQQLQPACSRKQTLDVAIVHYAGLAFLVAQQDRKVNQIRVVGRVGIEDPLQQAQSPGSSMISACDKGLAHVVRNDERDATRAAVLICGLHLSS